jgi:methylmalonyl-CoA/ethylmalonyl-CoA epimerase
MITGLAHIGIAVSDLEEAIALWTKVTGGKLVHRETVTAQKVEVAVIAVGDLRVELLSGTSEDSPISRFVAERGAGIHHLALQSTSVQPELERLRKAGVRLIDQSPRDSAENTRVGFLHPKALGGVLVEIVEHGKP